MPTLWLAAKSWRCSGASRQGIKVIAWGEFSHTSRVESPSTNSWPAQRRAYSPVRSTPCHKFAPEVSPLEATDRKSSVAPDASCVVAFRACTATPVVCSERSAAAPMMRATCITGPWLPLISTAIPKHMQRVPPNIDPHLGKRSLGKNGPLLRANHETPTAFPLSLAEGPARKLFTGWGLGNTGAGAAVDMSLCNCSSRHLRLP